jgi:hypothetical protein
MVEEADGTFNRYKKVVEWTLKSKHMKVS